MSEAEPWTADRELDAHSAARAIGEALPELAGEPTVLLGEGWDFDAYEVAGRWVFRFPRRAAEQARLRRDLILLPWLHGRLHAPVPNYAWGELRAEAFPYIFSGYAKLEGVNASARHPDRVDLARLGAGLGAQLRQLHALEPPAAVREALSQPTTPLAANVQRLRRYLAPFVAEVEPALAARATRFFDDGDLVPPAARRPASIVHDDLHAEHLLLAGDDVAGLLDWSDAAFGDPASDFAAIYPWGGEPLLQAMLAAYGDPGPAFETRARFKGLLSSFIDFSHWVRVGRREAAAWTRCVLAAQLPP